MTEQQPQQVSAMPVGTVSVLDVFARVVQMQVELGKIDEKLNALPDHELRIRILERFRYTLAGVAILGGGLAGYGGYLLGHVTH